MSEDLQVNWLNVARRCQSVACSQKGFAVLTVRILIGPSGDPVFWMTPKMDSIEPMRSASVFLHQVMERITE